MSVVTVDRVWLDHERCYRALSSRDARFDGWFYAAVRSTGIYCRPSCSARTPRPVNVEFVATAAAAQQRGLRACKRCRPDATPGSPDWDVRADVSGRAMRMIADGTIDREGVPGLANRLGYSTRQLQRLLVAEVGAGPLALARAQRAHTARILLETTDLAVTDVAFAAGFASVRQFNDTVREVYASTPTDLRRGRGSAGMGCPVPRGGAASAGALTTSIRLAARRPFAAAELLAFLAARAVPGVEHHVDGSYERTMRLPHGHGVVSLVPDDHSPDDRTADGDAGPAALRATLRLEDWRDLAPAVQRLRRLADLDADPLAVDDVLGRDEVLGPLVSAVPGRRLPGSVDPFETAVRAVIGQQISVAGARTVAGRVVAAVGEPLRIPHANLGRVFPGASALAGIDPDDLPMPGSRKRTLAGLARAVDDGRLVLDDGVDRDVARAGLLALAGIGPWTADYVVMRGLHDPDVFLAGDLGVRHALAAAGLAPDHVAHWRPWRSYALHHLWAMPTRPPATAGIERGGRT
ncbi:MAG: AlkA N-terminal domain-containing protein [Ilumatobacteraceae bacterium]